MQLGSVSLPDDRLTYLPLKANLFVRVHELKSIIQQLRVIQNWHQTKKKGWFREHEQPLKQSLELFTQQISFELEQSQMDADFMSLMSEYTQYLQELAVIVQSHYPIKGN